MKNSAIITMLILALSLAFANENKTPGKITFKTGHEDYQADGEFKKWRFTRVEIPGGNIEKGEVEIEIDLASVSEKSADLAEHLRQWDYFDVAKFPVAKLLIANAKKQKEGYSAVATLDFHGFKKDMPVEFKVVSDVPLKIEGSAILNRGEFKIGPAFVEGKRRSVRNEVEIGFSATLPEKLSEKIDERN